MCILFMKYHYIYINFKKIQKKYLFNIYNQQTVIAITYFLLHCTSNKQDNKQTNVLFAIKVGLTKIHIAVGFQ